MKRLLGLGVLLTAVLLTACGGGAEPTPTPLPEQPFASMVSVTGEVVPAEWTTASAQLGGMALEVVVEPGDEVAAGDLLVRLDPAEAELAVRRAETALQAAQLRLALIESRPRPEEVAVARAQVEATKPGIDQAEARLAQLSAGSLDAEIAAADAQVTRMEIEELVAYEFHEDTMTCVDVEIPGEGKKEVCPLLGPTEEKARFRLQATREELEAARTRYQALIGQQADRLGAVELVVEQAEARQEAAEAQLAQVKAGASPEEIAAAEAAVQQAEAALAQAETALERAEVRASLGGTVGMVQVREHEVVAPGQPLVVIGDLTTLRVETTDLDEIDVARVEVGQAADVTFDALPDQVFVGRVTRISPMAESDGGGVNYTAIVELETLDPQIRWGMTAFVDIEVDG
jgi:multidrug resistance efflux pump